MENLVDFVQQVCQNHSREQITDILNMITEQNPQEAPEQLVDTAVGMLIGENTSTEPSDLTPTTPQPNIIQEGEDLLWEDELEGAVGFGHDNFNYHFNELANIFPDASEEFIWNYCQREGHNFDLDKAIDMFTIEGYDRKVSDVEAIWTRLQEALPMADPSYLKKQAEKLVTQDETRLQQFVNEALENNDLPSKQDFFKRKREEAKLSQYTKDFNYEHFLETFPDPETHFGNPDKENPLSSAEVSQEDLDYALTFLYNRYRKTRKRHILQVFNMMQKRFFDCCLYLDKFPGGMKCDRLEECSSESKNLALLQEVAYLKHRRYLRYQIQYKNQSYMELKEQARASNLLVTCPICVTEELIPEECFCCKKGCMFCKDCMQRYIENRIGSGLTDFPCCNDCDSQFDLHTLQLVLSREPEMFEKLVLKIQSEEVKKANVDGLETCLFCDYADIPPADSKIFKCQNPDCLKESCRLCRHEAHVPLRCNEIEYDEDVRIRTYIENLMTEGLARTCHSCGKKFVKTGGCNKMTCTCGAKMCYLCSQPVQDYTHFGEPPRCQLFTNDAQVNLARVKANVEKARRDLGNVEVKFDPTVNIENHFTS